MVQRSARDVLTDEFYGNHIAADHLLEALTDAGFAVVQLPAPDDVGDYGPVWETANRCNGPVGTVQYRPEIRRIEIRDDYEHDYEPADVQTDGLVLLAAAKWAVDHG